MEYSLSLPNVQLVSVHMTQATERIIEVMNQFGKLEKWLEVDLGSYRDKVAGMLLKELEFFFHPSQPESQVLDNEWKTWADSMMVTVEDAALDLDFTSHRNILNKYLQERQVARGKIIERVKIN